MKKQKRKFSHHKLLQAQIIAAEQQYWERYNSGIMQWIQNKYE
jgi:hypothetical protein